MDWSSEDWTLFHELWGAAIESPEYSKADWIKMQDRLREAAAALSLSAVAVKLRVPNVVWCGICAMSPMRLVKTWDDAAGQQLDYECDNKHKFSVHFAKEATDAATTRQPPE